jgi:hypothetical protein
MNSISYVDPTIETIDEIIWHNIKEADSILNLNLFITSAMAWIENNPTKTFQDLERELRKRNLNTHLYAKEFEKKDNFVLTAPNKLFEPKYECIYSCRPPKYALEEIMQYWNSYEENFEKLALAGMLTVKSADDIQDREDCVKFSETQQSYHDLITKCKKLIKITKITSREYIEKICTDIKNQTGKTPANKVIGMTSNGSPVFGMFIGDQLVSNIGFSVKYNSNCEPVLTLIDLP